MIRLRCPCGEFDKTSTDTHQLKTEYYEHRAECRPHHRGLFHAHNKEEETT